MWLPTVDHIMRPTPGTIINPKMQQWLIIEYLNFPVEKEIGIQADSKQQVFKLRTSCKMEISD